MVSVMLCADCTSFIFHITLHILPVAIFFMPLLSLSSVLFLFFPAHLNFLAFFSFLHYPSKERGQGKTEHCPYMIWNDEKVVICDTGFEYFCSNLRTFK